MPDEQPLISHSAHPHRGRLAAIALSAMLGSVCALAQSTLPLPVEEATDSVVTLTVYDVSGALLRKGSGFAIGGGLLVTNLHVVANANVVEMSTSDGELMYARSVLRVDQPWDLAVLDIQGLDLKPLSLSAAGSARVGIAVHAVGGAPGGRGNAVITGIVSGARDHEGDQLLLEISNQISVLASGGPLLEATGKVLGVTIYGGAVASDRHFAAPAKVLRAMLPQMDRDAPLVVLSQLSEQTRERMAQAQVQRRRMLSECAIDDIATTDRVIKEAIVVGAPIYNQDQALACYKIYEGATYKALYLLADRCAAASDVLADAVTRSAREETPARKAWLLRYAFDTVLGVPTHEPRPKPEL